LGGIGCTNYRNDSERDEENPEGEHGRVRKGRVVENEYGDSGLYIARLGTGRGMPAGRCPMSDNRG
jgi:hypothetical protein